jgi:hypothetical protein
MSISIACEIVIMEQVAWLQCLEPPRTIPMFEGCWLDLSD